jgi:hypothetical protein
MIPFLKNTFNVAREANFDLKEKIPGIPESRNQAHMLVYLYF